MNESDVALQQWSKSHHQAGSTRLKGSRPCCIKHLQAHPPGVGHWNLPQDHPVRKGQWQWVLARILSTAGRPRSDGKNPTFFDKPKKCCHNFFRNKNNFKIDTKIGIAWSSQVPNVGFMTAEITGMIDASTIKQTTKKSNYTCLIRKNFNPACSTSRHDLQCSTQIRSSKKSFVSLSCVTQAAVMVSRELS